jgi:HAE1 family hydrophobic/amphiphilic exporter-1
MTLIPTLAARILGRESSGTEKQPGILHRLTDPVVSAFARVPGAIASLVSWINTGTARRLTVVLGLTLIAVVGSRLLMPKAEYLPTGNSNFVIALLFPPPGYNPDEIRQIGEEFEAELRPYWETEPGSPEAEALPGGGIRTFFYAGIGTDQVFMGLRARDSGRIRELVPIVQQMLGRVPGAYGIALQWSIFSDDASSGRSIDVDLRGPDLENLVAAGGALLGQIYATVPGVQAIPRPALDLANPEIRLTPDRRRMADVGLTNRELGFTVSALVDGAKVSDYRIDGREVDLMLKGDDETFVYGHDLESVPINTPSGKLVTLGSVARIENIGGPTQVNHQDRQRAIRIAVTPSRAMALEEAMEILEGQIIPQARESGVLPPSISVHLTGTADDLTRTRQALMGNFLLALAVTYLLMAALFQSWAYPMVIMFSVPLATFGGFLGLRITHLITGQNMDILTMLGFVILIGIVVNNAILIVHQSLNLMRDQGMGPDDAIRESVRTRVRPIFMSTATSVFGMLPLVLFPGAGSELYRGLGSVVIGGLALSTIFTLVLVPALFSLTVDARRYLTRLLERRRTTPEAA